MCSSFNPRPLRRAGDTRKTDPTWPVRKVSIRARSEERAIRRGSGSSFSSSRGFNPRPLRRAGDTRESGFLPPSPLSFNPRPLRRAGDTWRGHGTRPRRSCFNPRPLRRAGDTELPDEVAARGRVSIRARSEERAIRNTGEDGPRDDHVSIRARSEERAILIGLGLNVVTAMFQSAPAPKSGRYRGPTADRFYYERFNPRPLRRAGDT